MKNKYIVWVGRLSKLTLLSTLLSLFSISTTHAITPTCIWTGSGDGIHWSSSLNWSCTSGSVPGNGYNLSFDTTSLTGPDILNDDISNLSLGSISFTGNSIFLYSISGDAFSLSGGISDSSTTGNDIQNNITLTGNQGFNTLHGGTSFDGNINTGSYNLNISGTNEMILDGSITGTGTIVSTDTRLIDETNSPSFAGSIYINGGFFIINSSTDPNAIGSSSVYVANGASLSNSVNGTGLYTQSNPITLSGGNGYNGYGQLDVHLYSGSPEAIDYTGPITLEGNSTVSLEGDNLNINGLLSGCGYSLSLLNGSSGTLGGTLTGSCAQNTSKQPTSSSNSNSSKSPDTGYGEPISSKPIYFLIFCSIPLLVLGTWLYRHHPS